MLLLNELLELISRKKVLVRDNFTFFDTALKLYVHRNYRNLLLLKQFRQINYQVISIVIVKTLLSRNFCQKEIFR